MKTYEEKKKALYETIRNYVQQDLCIAFSGGVDSSLLLKLAKKYAEEKKSRIYAVTFDTILHPSCDLEIAQKVAKETGVIHKVIFVNELEQADIRFNPENRCYLCKKALFEKLKEYAREVHAGMILEGTNEDDLHVYRPGIKAVKELGIISPLADCGFTKEEVRKLAGELGISVAGRPSTPCLATRLPYGVQIKMETLHQIAEGEEYLKSRGFMVVRLRVHQDIARVEIPREQFGKFLEQGDEIVKKLKEIGFDYITLDMQGFRSGSMDEKRTEKI